MAEEPLDRVQIDARLEQVRRKGVAQRMDPARFGDPRFPLGDGVGPLHPRAIQGPPRPTGEQPGRSLTFAVQAVFPLFRRTSAS